MHHRNNKYEESKHGEIIDKQLRVKAEFQFLKDR